MDFWCCGMLGDNFLSKLVDNLKTIHVIFYEIYLVNLSIINKQPL